MLTRRSTSMILGITETDVTVLQDYKDHTGDCVAILDQTVFYPQGRGQPTDLGGLITVTGRSNVRRISFLDDEVIYTGAADSTLPIGDSAYVTANGVLRRRHTLLHSGGHLVPTGHRCITWMFWNYRWPCRPM
ncbi:hypothetical protein GCM10027176_36920 [Actinoallomurus bryophytorum]|uniref:tRNA synthetase class II (A) n=1 Tax=Actinoallomurus bryophytorum TaxID=1490222 RepID=A0A543CIU7_9ACTN|nr:tRNA synthetase class II (A) [Actinoallomurus bryophytorum]